MTNIRSAATRNRASYGRDLFWAGIAATLVSGAPSTVYAWLSGGDVLEATRAAGAMLVPANSSPGELVLAAGVVHVTVSFLWAALLVLVLPRRHVVLWAVPAAGLIGLFDLRVVAPLYFPEVAALPLAPQMADHLMWGASLGWVLARRWSVKQEVRQSDGRDARGDQHDLP
jgi:hypothetical protein